MDPKIRRWLDAQKEVIRANGLSKMLLDDARNTRPPKKLREATPDDVRVDAVFWYFFEGEQGDMWWTCIKEVLDPESSWIAYISHDGGRYGLEGAMVEDDD